MLDIARPGLVVADDGHAGDVTITDLLAERRGAGGGVGPRSTRPTPTSSSSPAGPPASPRACALAPDRTGCAPSRPWPVGGARRDMFPQFHWRAGPSPTTPGTSGHELALVDGATPGTCSRPWPVGGSAASTASPRSGAGSSTADR